MLLVNLRRFESSQENQTYVAEHLMATPTFHGSKIVIKMSTGCFLKHMMDLNLTTPSFSEKITDPFELGIKLGL
jgi:hypothetical protein